jgi:Uma2 family endonuclease
VFTGVEVRLRLAVDLYRIPDISMWEGAEPEKLPSSPPLLVVEVVSPDDRVNDLLQKLEEYRVWGVRHIWLVEPELKQIHVYENGSLTRVARFELPRFGLAVTAGELFR